MTRPCLIRLLYVVPLAVVLAMLAACSTPGPDLRPDVDSTPTTTVTDVPALTAEPTLPATQAAATATTTATATPGVISEDNCQGYLGLEARFAETTQRAVVTTYRCHNAWIDSTGQSPPRSPDAIAKPGAPIAFTGYGFTTEQPPQSIDVRLYPGAGVSASFLRWPEELPTGVEPVDRHTPDPGPDFQYIPAVAPGEYSLVIRIAWEGDVDVFYALSFALEGAATLPPTEEAARWATYANPVFHVSLHYPAHWQPVPGEEETRYAAPSDGVPSDGGFFILDAIGAPQATIDEVAAGQAGHKLRPYGSQPEIEPLQVEGQEARLILPSADASMGDQAMLIVRYPQPVDLSGATYQFFALYADEGHIWAITRSLRFEGLALPERTWTPAPPSGGGAARPTIDSFQVTPAQAEPGDTVTLTWDAGGKQATLCPSARYVLFTSDDCRPVELAGSMTFTLPPDPAGNRTIDFILTVEGEEDTRPEVWQASVALKCSTTWFFSDEPQAGVCPRAAIRTSAAAQRFERGTMIWLERLGRYLILQEAPVVEGEARKRVDVLHDPLRVIRDSPAPGQPPAGLYAPESGFGLVWRGDVQGSPGYVQALGWALAPEYAYEGLYQCDDALPSGGRSWQICYLEGPDGEVYVLHPLGGWYLLDERSR
jgi:hypothetical protein